MKVEIVNSPVLPSPGQVWRYSNGELYLVVPTTEPGDKLTFLNMTTFNTYYSMWEDSVHSWRMFFTYAGTMKVTP